MVHSAARGANVDFVRVENDQRLYFRVYERGVEDETLSSGTGSMAAALAAAAAGKVSSPVICAARGADLIVRFRRVDNADEPAATRDESDLATEAPVGVPADPAPEPETGAAALLPPLVESVASEDRVEFFELEIEGDAMLIYSGEATVQASRAARRG